MIVFENAGEIDIDAITTFGVSVKVGENPIGFFGTGLKYAIAVLLRTDHKVSIWSGDRQLRFTTERREVRMKPFDFVLMREGDRLTPMGFTTELGKTWKPWMAYRELYCNARDEGGSVYSVANPNAATDPRRGQTQIRVEGAEAFLAAVGKLKERGATSIATSALRVWERDVPMQFQPRPSPLDADERNALHEARALCERFAFDISDILAVEETPGADATYAQDGTLYLLRNRISDQTVLELAGDLIRGSMARDGLDQDERETRLIERLLASVEAMS